MTNSGETNIGFLVENSPNTCSLSIPLEKFCEFCFIELRFRVIFLRVKARRKPRHKQDVAASTGLREGGLLCLQSYFDLINVNRNTENDFQSKELSLLESRGL